MTGKFPLRIQGMVFRMLGISLLAFLYVAVTLLRAAFQQTLSQQAREDPSPTPHPSVLTHGVRFALFRVYSPLLAECLLASLPLASKMLHFARFSFLSESAEADKLHWEIPGSQPPCG